MTLSFGQKMSDLWKTAKNEFGPNSGKNPRRNRVAWNEGKLWIGLPNIPWPYSKTLLGYLEGSKFVLIVGFKFSVVFLFLRGVPAVGSGHNHPWNRKTGDKLTHRLALWLISAKLTVITGQDGAQSVVYILPTFGCKRHSKTHCET